MTFPCSSCGLCCQNIQNIKELKDFDNGSGICIKFDILNHTCSIYETRPEVCRVEKMYELYYAHQFSKHEFYVQNSLICNYLQDQKNLPQHYRLNIKE